MPVSGDENMTKYPELQGLTGNEYRKKWNKIHRREMNEAGRRYRRKYKGTGRRSKQFMDNHGHCETTHRNRKTIAFATQRYKRWEDIDERRVLEHSVPDSKLVKIIGRTMRSIMNKRRRLLKREFKCAGSSRER